MKTIVDPGNRLGRGLASIRTEFGIAGDFPPAVIAAAEEAARRAPTDHIDRTRRPFVTLDPATSTDLDQALWIDEHRDDLILHYAIADVDWYVTDGGPIDVEAWRRGETFYLPDGKASLYPPVLSQGAASLLPDGPRPAIIFIVRVGPDGSVRLDGAERAVIHSKAKLAYDRVLADDLPPAFEELARRIQFAEAQRGAVRIDPPEQEVLAAPDGGFALAFRPRLASESNNAAMSLATNLAIANLLQTHRTGLFRVMPPPDEHAIAKLRLTATGLHIEWPREMTLEQFERRLDGADPAHARLMLAIRRAGQGASYAPYRAGVTPWHAAMAATYAHATAPLRRLADRYVVRAAFEIANGRPVPAIVRDAFEKLPAVMGRADALAGKVERAVVDLAEAVSLSGDVGKMFSAIAIEADDHGAKIQLRERPVVARVAGSAIAPGTIFDVRLVAVQPERRTVTFERL